jgi:hypothetical protein
MLMRWSGVRIRDAVTLERPNSSMVALPVCAEWKVIIFDPNAALLWHWGVGKIDDSTQYVESALNSDQLAEDKKLTLAQPIQLVQTTQEVEHARSW